MVSFGVAFVHAPAEDEELFHFLHFLSYGRAAVLFSIDLFASMRRCSCIDK